MVNFWRKKKAELCIDKSVVAPNETSPGISYGVEKKAPAGGTICVPERHFTVSTTCQIIHVTIHDEIEAQTMGQWWVESHLVQDCRDVHISSLDLYSNFNRTMGPP